MGTHELLEQYFTAFDIVSNIYRDNADNPAASSLRDACITVENEILKLERMVIDKPFVSAEVTEVS